MMLKLFRVLGAALFLALLTSCAGRGINAGESGGRAFIAFAVMLLVTLGLMWLAIGRGD